MENPAGKLYIVPTPIGNLGDITLRALEALRGADVIAAEDTRHTRKLLTHYEIKKPLVACHEHNEAQASETLIGRMKGGETVALVTDAGMPAVSDPGRRLVERARETGIESTVLPGASAVTTALPASGFEMERFTFVGFAPSKQKARRALLREYRDRREALCLFEAPHRIRACLADIAAELDERRVAICRELSKLHEQVLIGTAAELLEQLPETVKGEITLVIEPGVESAEVSDEDIVRAARAFEGPPRKVAAAVAAELGAATNRVYELLRKAKEE